MNRGGGRGRRASVPAEVMAIVGFLHSRFRSAEQTSAPEQDQLMVIPPSTLRIWPVMNEASSEAMKTIAFCGRPGANSSRISAHYLYGKDRCGRRLRAGDRRGSRR
jgi:hypothetical protein